MIFFEFGLLTRVFFDGVYKDLSQIILIVFGIRRMIENDLECSGQIFEHIWFSKHWISSLAIFTIFNSICTTYRDALANRIPLVINSCINTINISWLAIGLLKLWLLSGGSAIRVQWSFHQRAWVIMFGVTDNEMRW